MAIKLNCINLCLDQIFEH